MNLPTNRMNKITYSGGIREILSKAAELEKEGKKVIHMEIGRPDFGSPEIAVDAAIEALKKGQVHYSDISGVEELRVAIADNVKKTQGIDVDPSTEVVVGIGAAEGLMNCMLALLDVGDEIICFTPCFPAYFDDAYMAGIVPIEVPLKFSDGYKLNIKDLEERITTKTKMILINSPNNPTGNILSKDDLEKIASIVVKNDLFVISDEAYNDFYYEEKPISIATIPKMRDRTIIVNTTSKAYSMTGWRVGYTIAPPEVTKYLHKAHQNITTHPSTFAQYGAVAAYESGASWTDMMVKEFRRRREMVCSFLDQIDDLEYIKPAGAFYFFICIDRLNMNAAEFCEYIINEAGVALVPGDAFKCEKGRNFVRLAYANSYENIEEGLKRIKSAVEKLNNE